MSNLKELYELLDDNSEVSYEDSPEPAVNIIEKAIPIPSRENNMKNRDYSKEAMWSIHHGIHFMPCEKAVDKLPAGQYIFTETDAGVFLTKKDVNLDELIRFDDGDFNDIIVELDKFWNSEDKFKQFNLLFKRGILLWGPPGSGKTSLIQIISQIITERDGLAIYALCPYSAAKGLQRLRQIEPERKIVLIMEDIDTMILNSGEHGLLALLDGELQINNIVFLATTNYPEKLDKRIINRPSRFDIIKLIGMPSSSIRKQYLQYKNPNLTEQQLKYWTNKTEGFSLAHLREVIVAVECLGQDFDSVVERLNLMSTTRPTSDKYHTGDFGFISK